MQPCFAKSPTANAIIGSKRARYCWTASRVYVAIINLQSATTNTHGNNIMPHLIRAYYAIFQIYMIQTCHKKREYINGEVIFRICSRLLLVGVLVLLRPLVAIDVVVEFMSHVRHRSRLSRSRLSRENNRDNGNVYEFSDNVIIGSKLTLYKGTKFMKKYQN